jgi:hypothetical protein
LKPLEIQGDRRWRRNVKFAAITQRLCPIEINRGDWSTRFAVLAMHCDLEGILNEYCSFNKRKGKMLIRRMVSGGAALKETQSANQTANFRDAVVPGRCCHREADDI